jgi:hypothetical protein
MKRDSAVGDDSEIFQLVSLVRYITILANRYPQPMTYKELANKARVSKAAISNVKDRLNSICDIRVLANKRKLLLSSDAKTISRIFFAFFMSSKPGPLLKTAYVRTLWRGWISQLHEKLSKTLPEYPMFFSNDDAVFASELLLRNIADSLTRTPPPKVTAFDDEGVRYAIIDLVQNIMRRLGPNFTRYLRDETTLKRILILRDKAWFLFLRVARQNIPKTFAAILQTLPDDDTRQTYVQIYHATVVFYIQRIVFGYITEQIKISAESAGVRYDEDYSTLGRFYSPSDAETSTQSQLESIPAV